MASFQGVHVNDVHHSVAMACIALIPPILVFVVAQRSSCAASRPAAGGPDVPFRRPMLPIANADARAPATA